ncbi:MAG TPA: hypothetical protein DCY24_06205 [Rikenellaceae bacterium]|nr:hypothetical protein [Rikenellaceae bacterium]
MKRILLFITLALTSLMFFSCLKSQEDVFDEPSAVRLQKLIRAYKDTLAASKNGWIMQYYPIPSKDYGGFDYWLKFDNDQNVSVYTNLTFSDGTVKTSLYDIIPERGPVLTFNTYNDILHFFTTPSSEYYQGYQSDYEFVIESYEDGIFTLVGKIYGNKMYLIRLGDSKTPAEYLDNVANNSYRLIKGDFNCTTEEGTAMYFQSSAKVNFRYLDGEDTVVVTRPFALTDDGIDLNTPVEFNGHSMRRFKIDYSDGSYVCTDKGQEDMRFEYDHPDTYVKYDDLIGDYYCVCGMLMFDIDGQPVEHLDSIRCSFRQAEDKRYLIASGLVQVPKESSTGSTPEYVEADIKIKYDPFFGTFGMISQLIDEKSKLCMLGYQRTWGFGESFYITYISDGKGHYAGYSPYSTAARFGMFYATDLNFNSATKIKQARNCWRCLDNSGSFTIVRWTKI